MIVEHGDTAGVGIRDHLPSLWAQIGGRWFHANVVSNNRNIAKNKKRCSGAGHENIPPFLLTACGMYADVRKDSLWIIALLREK